MRIVILIHGSSFLSHSLTNFIGVRVAAGTKFSDRFSSLLQLVRNSACLYMRTLCLNIYMYIKEKLHKEPLKEYNNEKG
jgi:hypothetical protein